MNSVAFDRVEREGIKRILSVMLQIEGYFETFCVLLLIFLLSI